MKLVFDEKDMIDFVKWYDEQNEESLGRTFEEDFNTWKTLKINTCAICSDCKKCYHNISTNSLHIICDLH